MFGIRFGFRFDKFLKSLYYFNFDIVSFSGSKEDEINKAMKSTYRYVVDLSNIGTLYFISYFDSTVNQIFPSEFQ